MFQFMGGYKENGKYLFPLRKTHMWRIQNCNKVEIQIEKVFCCKITEASGMWWWKYDLLPNFW